MLVLPSYSSENAQKLNWISVEDVWLVLIQFVEAMAKIILTRAKLIVVEYKLFPKVFVRTLGLGVVFVPRFINQFVVMIGKLTQTLVRLDAKMLELGSKVLVFLEVLWEAAWMLPKKVVKVKKEVI